MLQANSLLSKLLSNLLSNLFSRTPSSRLPILSKLTRVSSRSTLLIASSLFIFACARAPGFELHESGPAIVNVYVVEAPAKHRPPSGESSHSQLARSIVALVTQDASHQRLCTGTILTKELVLTAAHCVDGMKNEGSQQMFVVFSTNLDARPGLDDVIRIADRAEQNPRWGKSDKNGRGDLALVHFSGGLPEGFVPVQLADDKINLHVGSSVSMYGFGVTDGRKRVGSGVLRETTTTVLSTLSPTEVVTDGHKTSVCFGDSGGPAFIQSGDHWVQWGIASSVSSEACNETSVHTFVVSYLPWLHQAAARLRN